MEQRILLASTLVYVHRDATPATFRRECLDDLPPDGRQDIRRGHEERSRPHAIRGLG